MTTDACNVVKRIAALLGVLLGMTQLPNFVHAECGGLNQKSCCFCDGSACDSGLFEICGCDACVACDTGNCEGAACAIIPPFPPQSNGYCVALTPCGGEGERACCTNEQIPSCDTGYVETGSCKDTLGRLQCGCDGGPFISGGMCVDNGCGGMGERACCIGENGYGALGAGCDPGLVEKGSCVDILGSGNCGGCSIGVCLDITPCGGEGERACCFLEDISIGACESGLVENGNCDSELGTTNCFCGGLSLAKSSGVCKKPDCGGAGERGCCLLERVPSCDPGLIEDLSPGCSAELGSSNCDCGFGPGQSLGVCRALKGLGEIGCDPLFDPCASGLVCRAVGAGIGDTMCLPQQGDQLFGDQLCAALYVPALHQAAIATGITSTYGTSATVSAAVSASAEVGVAYSGTDKCYGCYLTTCGGVNFDVSVGVAACFGQIYDGLWGSVGGNSCSLSIGAEIPFTEIGASVTTVFAGSNPVPNPTDCLSVPVGTAECFSIGLGLNPLPVDGAIELCHTFTNLVACIDETVSTDGDLVPTPDEPPTCMNGLTLGICPNSGPIMMMPLAFDPDGDPLTYSWATTCNGTFDHTNTAMPTLTFNSAPTCSGLNCTVTVTANGSVSDGTTTTPVQVVCPASLTNDSNPPGFTMFPDNVTIGCDASSAPANTGMAEASDTCDATPAITYSDSQVAGSCPRDKTITRTWQAEDACGNKRMQNQTITVEDSTAPTPSCPSDITSATRRHPNFGESAEVTFSVTASDNCDPSPLSVCTAPGATDVTTAGGTFPPGTTLVTCSATDDCSNTSTGCSFNVRVPYCGDGIVDDGEYCDGTAGPCPDSCQSNCRCPTGQIPTVSEWGLGVTAILGLVIGMVMFAHRNRQWTEPGNRS